MSNLQSSTLKTNSEKDSKPDNTLPDKEIDTWGDKSSQVRSKESGNSGGKDLAIKKEEKEIKDLEEGNEDLKPDNTLPELPEEDYNRLPKNSEDRKKFKPKVDNSLPTLPSNINKPSNTLPSEQGKPKVDNTLPEPPKAQPKT